MPLPAPPNRKQSKTAQVLSQLGNRKKRHIEPEEPDHSNDEVWLISYSDMMTLLFGFFVILFSMSTLDKNKYDSFKRAAAKGFGGEYQLPTENLKRQVDVSLKDAGLKNDDVQVVQNLEGLELNFKGQAFFASGSAELSPQAKTFVLKAVQAVKETGNDYTVRVEGHTDDVPIKSNVFPSNWELSSARATAVLRLLEENGVDARQLEAIGYGSSRPLKPNRDNQNHPIEANMALNRRIVVKLKKMDPSELRELKLPPKGPTAGQSARTEAPSPQVSADRSPATLGLPSSNTTPSLASPGSVPSTQIPKDALAAPSGSKKR